MPDARRIQLRRGTAAEWLAANPILAQGEPGVEWDTGKQKIGNGTTEWASLAYTSQGPAGPRGPSVETQLARTPEALIVGVITRDTGGAPTQAAVLWPDGTTGLFTGTPSPTFAGALDSYTITYGTTRTYTQPPVTRDSTGTIIDQPAIVLS